MKGLVISLAAIVGLILGAIWLRSDGSASEKKSYDVVYLKGVHNNIRVVEYTYKGHDYQMHKCDLGRSSYGGPVHDPDCKLCNSK